MTKARSHLALLALGCSSALGSAHPGTGVWIDPADDAGIRRTDVGNNASLPVDFLPIDLLAVYLQGWSTPTPTTDPYAGAPITRDADLMRLQITLAGLIAPPGPLALDGFVYDPTLFGDRPIYGYFEIDIDDDTDTGGELSSFARNRYLANVGRFGMSPAGSIADRMVRNGNDFDSNYFSEPQFERSGGEFSLLMCGCFTPTIESQNGNMDSTFDPGETWIVSGRFFERFVSFQSASGLFGGFSDGLFDPIVNLQFVHDMAADQTTITLIFPITNAGAAMLTGEPIEPIDISLLNHTSIEEAIDDLIFGSDFTDGPLEELVEGWEEAQVTDYRKPAQWALSALIGTAPTEPDSSALFIWTDTGFNETFGDLNNDQMSDLDDSQVITDTIEELDGTVSDADGIINGQIAIPNFGFEFNIIDLSGDGLISPDDIQIPLCQADLNHDGTLNFFDVSAFLSAFAAQDPIADFTGEGSFNFFDVSAFLVAYSAGCS